VNTLWLRHSGAGPSSTSDGSGCGRLEIGVRAQRRDTLLRRPVALGGAEDEPHRACGLDAKRGAATDDRALPLAEHQRRRASAVSVSSPASTTMVSMCG
jgi:hypothetical protein